MAGFVIDAPAYTGETQPYVAGGAEPPDPRRVQDIGDAIMAGLKASSGGLILRGKLPDQQLGEDAPWYHRAAYGVGGLAGDVPAMIAGAVAGGATVGAVSGPAAPIAAPIGAGAGAFAVPMALRDALTEAYGLGHAVSWADASSIAFAALKGGAKGAAIGAVTGGAGAIVGRTLGSTLAPAVGQSLTGTAANRIVGGSMLASELATLTTASAAVEGHMPSARDFMDNAILLGGLKGAVHVAKGLRGIYAETGKKPAEVLSDAAADPRIALDLKPVEAPIKSEAMVDVYHGSPHAFDKFDATKIGTGEGAQAYGHGLYFADSPGVAGSYKVGTTDVPYGTAFDVNQLSGEIARQASSGDKSVMFAKLQEMKERGYGTKFGSAYKKAIDSVRTPNDFADVNLKEGSLYKVQIPQRVVDSMLDWDRPLSEQADSVQKAIRIYKGANWYLLNKNILAAKLVREIQAKNPEDFASAMRDMGVSGVKYFDRDSRVAGDGTRNYVLFDAEHATVIERNGQRIGETGKKPAEVLSDAAADPALKAELTGGPAMAGLERARESNTFVGQSPGAGRLVGYTQPAGTPAERVFSNFADGMSGDALAKFREGMMSRADQSPRAFKNDNVAVTDLPFGDGLVARIEAAASGRTRVRVMEGDVVLAAARVDRGLFDSLAVTATAKGRGIGVDLVTLLRDERIANVVEVPDRSPGYVRTLRAVLARPTGEPTMALAADRTPSAYSALALEQRIQSSLKQDARPEEIAKALTDLDKPLKLGEPPIADVVRTEYVTDADTHKGLLRLITERYNKEIETQRRGVVPNAATLADAADRAGVGLKPHEVGAAANAAETTARLMILRSATADAFAKVQKLAGMDPAEVAPLHKLEAYAALEKLAALKAEADGVLAEWGRTGQMVRQIKRDPSLLGDADSLLKMIERKGDLQDVARAIAKMNDPAQLLQFAEQYTKATTLEQVIYAWKAGTLSGILTTGANVLGNVGKLGFDIVEAPVTSALFALDRAAHGDPLKSAQIKARAMAPLTGIQIGALDGLKIAAEVWQQKGTHLERLDIQRNPIPTNTLFGKAVSIPYRMLSVQDAFFRTMAERAQAHVEAVDRAVRDGLQPGTREFKEATVKYTNQPELGLAAEAAAAVLKRIEDTGTEAVFSQRLGPLTEKLSAAIGGTPLEFIIPYRRTPANLVSWAVQHTPGLQLLSGRWRADWEAGGERQSRAIARVIAGTALAATAYSLAESGAVTGSGLFDKEMGGTKRAAGWQPNSFRIDGKYYSYARLEPVAKVIGIATDLVELQKSAIDKEDKAKIAGMLVLVFGNATVSTTYLSGLSAVMQGLTDPERYGSNLMEQYASSLVPKIIGQSVGLVDPNKREVDGVLDAIQAQLPFIREKLLPKRDVWGEKVLNERLFTVLPLTSTTQSEDKVRNEAVRLAVAIADAPRFVQESGPFGNKEKRIELTPAQRDVFRETAGKQAMTILAPIVNSPDWGNIPDFAKAAIYRDVLTGARKSGQYAALPPMAAERQAMREKIVNKIIQQTLKVEGQ